MNGQKVNEKTTFMRARSLTIALGLFSLLALSSVPAQAYYSTIDTGDMIEPEKFQAILEPQLLLNRFDGFNLVGRLDVGLTEATSVRGIIGFGKVDFQIGALYKWIPIPDVENQPAIGVEAGAIFARVDGGTRVDFRVHPLVSKRFETEIGDVTPYGSIPLGLSSTPDGTFVPVQLVAGAELRPLNMPNMSFFGELGIDVAKSFSYISAAVAYRFDEASLKGN